MKKIYIVAKGNVEGIQDIRSVHLTQSGALVAWKKLCDDLVKEYEEMIDHELEYGHGDRWIRRSEDRIQILKTYDTDLIEEKLYPSETPIIIEMNLKK